MKKIGITGGIGSGKTTVCRIFEVLGIPVYYADHKARYLMENDPQLIDEIKKHFGPSVYDEAGNLNRKELAKRVFDNESELHKLNELVHPVVGRDSEAWFKAQSGTPYVLKEAALLFESGAYQSLDLLITVTSPFELRIHRIRKRDQVMRKEVLKRMGNQWPQEQKVSKSDFIISNNENEMLVPQVMKIHEKLKD